MSQYQLAEPTIAQLKEYYQKHSTFNYNTMHIIVSVIAAIFTLPLLTSDDKLAAVIIIVVAQVGIYAFIKGAKYAAIKSAKNDFIFNDIAAKNNLTFTKSFAYTSGAEFTLFGKKIQSATNNTLATTNGPNRTGILFGLGHSKRYMQIVGNNKFAIFNYRYVTGSGKNSKTHNVHVASWKLSRPLPHLLFDAKKNNFWRMSNIASGLDSSQKISLESTFDDHFILYSPETYDIDTLSFITPEVMEYMINKMHNYDIEVIDGEILIYGSNHIKPKDFWDLYSILHGFAAHLEDNIDSYRDQRSTQMASTGDARNTIAKKGLRLKRSVWPGLISAFIFLAYIGIRLWAETGSSRIGVIVTIISFGGIFAYAGIKHYRNNKHE